MPIHFSCPHCQTALSTAKRKAGLAVPCPKCRIGVLVPLPEATPVFVAVEPASPAGTASNRRGVYLILGVLALGLWCLYQATLSASVPPANTVANLKTTPPSLPPEKPVPQPPAVDKPEPPAQPEPPAGPPVVKPPEKKDPPKPTPPPTPPVKPQPPKPPVVPPQQPSASERPAMAQKQPAPAAAPPVVTVMFPRWTEEELRRDLGKAPEMRLKQQTAHQLLLLAAAHLRQQKAKHATEQMVAVQPELAGMPFLKGHSCELAPEPATTMHHLSQRMRLLLQAATVQERGHTRLDADRLRQLLRSERAWEDSFSTDPLELAGQLLLTRSGRFPNRSLSDWRQPAAIPTLTQMLQPESAPVRLLLVELLGAIPGEEASVALTRRAVFDLSREVRAAAVTQLKMRPRTQFRQELLAAFRHPWPQASFHAAEALCALEDTESVPQLKALLEEPDPLAPFLVKDGPKETLMVREMVRVNHLSNCVMCHSPSFQESDPIRSKVPIAGQPLGSPGSGGYGLSSSPGTFIRADITYLRQDFSILQPVPSPGFWPKFQRFDYLVRLRPATKTDLLRLTDPDQAPKLKHAAQDALRLALRKLDPSPPAQRPAAEPPPKAKEPEQFQPPPKLRQPERPITVL